MEHPVHFWVPSVRGKKIVHDGSFWSRLIYYMLLAPAEQKKGEKNEAGKTTAGAVARKPMDRRDSRNHETDKGAARRGAEYLQNAGPPSYAHASLAGLW